MTRCYSKLLARAGYPLQVARMRYEPCRAVNRQSRTIYARFFLPAMAWAGEPAEWRTVNLNSRKDVEWVQDMAGNYAELKRHGLTTFFPGHP